MFRSERRGKNMFTLRRALHCNDSRIARAVEQIAEMVSGWNCVRRDLSGSAASFLQSPPVLEYNLSASP